MNSAVNNFFSRKRNKVLILLSALLLLGVVALVFYSSAQSEPHQPAPIINGWSRQNPQVRTVSHRQVSRLRTQRASTDTYSNQASSCGQGLERDQRSSQSHPGHVSGDEQLLNPVPTVPAFVPAQGRVIISISAGSTVTPTGAASVQISMEPPPAPRRYSSTDN